MTPRIVLTTLGLVAAISTPVLAASPPGTQIPHASSIHVLGTFNGWATQLFTSDPGMTFDGAVWRDTVGISAWEVEQSYQQFKFVTDRAYDSPPDYCLCPDRLDEYHALSGPVCLVPFGLNLQMYADVPGRYEFTLDETAQTYAARLVERFDAHFTGIVSFPGIAALPVANVWVVDSSTTLPAVHVTTDPATGQFDAGPLDGGTYNLSITAPGYLPKQIGDVILAAHGSHDLGPIVLTPGCTSQFSSVQVVGDFNAWDTNTPSMTFEGCAWKDTLHVTAGCYYMKFRTNGDWGNDFGTCTSQDPNCQSPLSGATCLVSGDLALGKINFPADDDYIFTLNEFTGTYAITEASTPARRETWGRLKVRYR